MRTIITRLSVVFSALTILAILVTVSAQERRALPGMLVCRDIKSILSLNDAFNRSERSGWERFAIEIGRSKKYWTDDRALDAHACLYKIDASGKILHSLRVGGRMIYAIEQGTFTGPHRDSFNTRRSIKGVVYIIAPPTPPPDQILALLP